MAFQTKFSLPSFINQVVKLTETQRNSITKVGFGHLLHIPPYTLRRTQLVELKETWNIERQSFIFPPVDITITLLDVVLILGLRVIGQPVILKQDAPLSTLEQEFGASISNRFITIESLKKRLESCGDTADSYFVRVFLLYCFGTLLFPSENGKVDSRYLLLLEDMDNVSSFAWGAAVREYLHESLTLWKTKNTSNVTGCLILLQIWFYEHIVIGRPKLLDYPSKFPRVCRWESTGRQKCVPIKFDELDNTQILWRLQPTLEELQIDIIKEIPQEWYVLSGPGTMEEPINIESERVNRMVQVHKEKEEEEEEEEEVETMRQQLSTILVLSDDDELNSIKDLKQENLELKASLEEVRKDYEVIKRENEVMKRKNEELEEIRKDYEVMKRENEIMNRKNEELQVLVEELQSDNMLMENCVSNLDRIASEYKFD